MANSTAAYPPVSRESFENCLLEIYLTLAINPHGLLGPRGLVLPTALELTGEDSSLQQTGSPPLRSFAA